MYMYRLGGADDQVQILGPWQMFDHPAAEVYIGADKIYAPGGLAGLQVVEY